MIMKRHSTMLLSFLPGRLALQASIRVKHLTTPATSTKVDSEAESLIPETLAAMEEERKAKALKGRSPSVSSSTSKSTSVAELKALGRTRLSLEERKRRRRALDGLGIAPFSRFLREQGLNLERTLTETLQLNIGLYCNQACNHCHVESSPKRTHEMMSEEVATRCLDFLRRSPSIHTLDLTGGAPELNAQFRYLVRAAAPSGVSIIDRCNLTVLEEPGQEDLPEFLAHHQVHVVASLPCYEEENVKRQRGSSVYKRSIAGLKKLNAQGYGHEGSSLKLTLVYNPVGAFLPPSQPRLQAQYKEELAARFGVVFNDLVCLTNMPIKRFADHLHRTGELEQYMQLLVQSFNPKAVEGLMCRTHLSVGWDGRVYDCDFNQQLGMTMRGVGAVSAPGGGGENKGLTVFDVQDARELLEMRRPISVDTHCFGCTAGEGSSCGGATVGEVATG
ncbi:hypothetical protein NSK_004974 [Nannochloropsis salina CCMP1776]|jgi:radical SAM/Cys-rich protein|uniref:DUF3641 domain-containing protein n=1 Tax=Nannochloropsis salina CCMP1776 TaxID=1027361 RepID=A0A4D9D0D8_9STRA|nr:hypothetical protein NSK_004974 [Nannochloropsis salina CCMP1776]|eukprot:TFJ83877.1 hypothetical protein NSK_004974 [Nannochloropsis salina CCMP1776]